MIGKRSDNHPAHRSGSRGPGDALGVAANLAGIAASLASVIGFLLSLRSGDGLWLLCGLGTAVFFLYAAWRRRRLAVAASAVILALVGVGGLIAHFHVLVKPAAAAQSASAPTGGQSTAASAPSSALSVTQSGTGTPQATTPTEASTPQPRIIEITLPRNAAVDLDTAGQPQVVDDQIGATGPYDLYHDASNGPDAIRAQDGVYTYPVDTSPDSAYAICSDYTGPDPSENTYSPSFYIETGTAFCFRTTAGKMAWATIQAVQPVTNTAVLQVRVWE
jgi:hypothetical protein